MKAPLFSIVIPAFNVEEYIEETLHSVIRQTISDFEVIVVNDGSSDATVERVLSIDDPRIRLISTKNRGVSNARNAGILTAIGKYIAFLDADDVWAEKHLEHAKVAFDNNPSIIWFSGASIISTETQHFPENKKESYIQVNYFENGCIYVNSSSVVFLKQAIEDLMPLFPIGMTNAEDWAAWAKIASIFPIITLYNGIDTICRLRESSASRKINQHEILKYLYLLPELRKIRKETASDMLDYIIYRTTHRWLLSISRRNIQIWRNSLQECENEISIFERHIISFYILINSILDKVTCKILSMIDNRRTRLKEKSLSKKFNLK